MVKENKTDLKPKSCETVTKPERICDSRCKICSSEFVVEIHDLKKAGHTYEKIAKIVKKELNFSIHSSSIYRHFQSYQKNKNLISAEIINYDLIQEATKQAIHTKKLVTLIDVAFKQIKIQLKARTLIFGVESLEKLIKLRYQIMQGQESSEEDVLAIFQKASDKYGLNVHQRVMVFKKKKTARTLGGEAE